jgi:hypothetical protein
VPDQLSVLAEVAVGLAGFSSIIVVFRRRSATDAWEPEDAFRFKLMLEASLVAGLFAISPGAIAGLGLSPDLIWSAHSAALLSYLASDLLRRMYQFRSLPAQSLSPRIAGVLLLGGVITIVIQALNVFRFGIPHGPGPYLFGVSWLIIYSGIMFYRLITTPITTTSSEDARRLTSR